MTKQYLVPSLFALSLLLTGAGCSADSTTRLQTTQQPSPAPEVKPVAPPAEPSAPATQPAATTTKPAAEAKPEVKVKATVLAETNTVVKAPVVGVAETGATAIVKAEVTVKSFTVTGGNFKFAPAAITVKQGDKVRITFKNEDGFHDWKIDEFNAATKKINAGAEETIEFVADKKGSFEYYCSVGSHRQMGMKGTLVVQ